MRLWALFLCIAVGFLPVGGKAFAQDASKVAPVDSAQKNEEKALKPGKGPTESARDRLTYFFQPQYNQLVRTAVLRWPKPFNFLQMRAMYARTRQYDPLGQDTLKKMADMSYAIEHEKTLGARTSRQEEFQALVLEHLGSLDVMLQALSLARGDSGYGDPAFYEWVVKGIEADVMADHNGRTMKDAYILITMGDEALIFKRLKAKSTYVEMVSDGSQFYYIHLAEDLKTHKQFELYINATIPMRVLKGRYNASDTGRPLDLRSK